MYIFKKLYNVYVWLNKNLVYFFTYTLCLHFPFKLRLHIQHKLMYIHVVKSHTQNTLWKYMVFIKFT